MQRTDKSMNMCARTEISPFTDSPHSLMLSIHWWPSCVWSWNWIVNDESVLISPIISQYVEHLFSSLNGSVTLFHWKSRRSVFKDNTLHGDLWYSIILIVFPQKCQSIKSQKQQCRVNNIEHFNYITLPFTKIFAWLQL